MYENDVRSTIRRILQSPILRVYMHTIVANIISLIIFTTTWTWLQ